MNHERFHEHMALHLYGELDHDESAELDRHLAECHECRRFESELSRGLGQVRALATSRTDAELPADWSERLSAATSDRGGRRARLSPWLAAVTSFAAGILVTALVTHRAEEPRPAPDRTHIGADEANYARYLRSTPPPPSTGGGQLARLSSYVKR